MSFTSEMIDLVNYFSFSLNTELLQIQIYFSIINEKFNLFVYIIKKQYFYYNVFNYKC